MGTSKAITSICYFVLAGLCEIGGGYLVWLWLREGKPAWYALVGAFVLVLYAIFPPSSQRISAVSTQHMAVFLLFF